MAITALLELQLKPDALENANAVIHETLAATRAFPGCLGVTVLVDSKDPAHVIVHESWESMDADSAYRKWRTTPEGASDLGSILAGAPTLTWLTEAEGVLPGRGRLPLTRGGRPAR
jgi:quinol monooxygenase YgiN